LERAALFLESQGLTIDEIESSLEMLSSVSVVELFPFVVKHQAALARPDRVAVFQLGSEYFPPEEVHFLVYFWIDCVVHLLFFFGTQDDDGLGLHARFTAAYGALQLVVEHGIEWLRQYVQSIIDASAV
jgi:hypothetical protein